jgi:hypothetical protein
MKALLLGVAFAIAMIFTSQAFATDLPDCPFAATSKPTHSCCNP